jgi:hypothetical protein
VAAAMRGLFSVVAGFGRLKFQIVILASLLALRLILFDFHLLSKFGAVEPFSQSHVKSSSAQPVSQSHAASSSVEPPALGTESNSGATYAETPCTAFQTVSPPMQRVLCASRARPELNLTDHLRNEIICHSRKSSTSPCPVFHPNISKFAGLVADVESTQKWAKLSQNEIQRQISLRMWQSKRLDIAAARVLGCGVIDGHEFTSAFENPKNMLHSNSICHLHQQINLLLPLVRGRELNRTQYLHDPSNSEWYRSFGYNPLATNDSRLAYEAPAFTQHDWMQFCFRQVARQSKKPESFEPQSRAWHACSSFAASTLSKNYHYGMLKCFDVPEPLMSATPEQLTEMLPVYGAQHREHIELCRSKNVTNDDVWSLRDVASGVFRALFDRWDLVQSVYELALYEHNRDIQRGDEFLEALQWNACHPDVQAMHMFVESNSSTYFETLTGPRDEDPSRFHDPCKKLHRVPLGKRMLYRDALEYANSNLSGSTVLITNADIVLSKGWSSMPELNSFLRGNKIFALARHERPVVILVPRLFVLRSTGNAAAGFRRARRLLLIELRRLPRWLHV